MRTPKSLVGLLSGIVIPATVADKALAKLHANRHPLDLRPPRGFSRVRLDGGDSRTPGEIREYTLIPTGFGEGTRAALARRRYVEPLRRGS